MFSIDSSIKLFNECIRNDNDHHYIPNKEVMTSHIENRSCSFLCKINDFLNVFNTSFQNGEKGGGGGCGGRNAQSASAGIQTNV